MATTGDEEIVTDGGVDEPDNDVEDESPTLPFEATMKTNFNAAGLGRLTGDLPDDYVSARVDVSYLRNIIETAEMFGWSEVRLSIMDDYPVAIQNADGDDAPTLVIAPRRSDEPHGGF